MTTFFYYLMFWVRIPSLGDILIWFSDMELENSVFQIQYCGVVFWSLVFFVGFITFLFLSRPLLLCPAPHTCSLFISVSAAATYLISFINPLFTSTSVCHCVSFMPCLVLLQLCFVLLLLPLESFVVFFNRVVVLNSVCSPASNVYKPWQNATQSNFLTSFLLSKLWLLCDLWPESVRWSHHCENCIQELSSLAVCGQLDTQTRI